MPVEKVQRRLVHKPWGVADLRPWNNAPADGEAVGEVWYERQGAGADTASLLLKLLFTSEPLSIQVHPDDQRAHAMGMRNGKTEAWYVLAAERGAMVALGLKRPLDRRQLAEAVRDGSIVDEVAWHAVAADDVIYVPAGTIHAIGAGLVLAELQQRSDVTYRLFDHGRDRALHPEDAVAASILSMPEPQVRANRMSNERTLLLANRYFVLERLELPPASAWSLLAPVESWLLALSGTASAGSFALAPGEALFAEMAVVEMTAGALGLTALIAYAGRDGPRADLLTRSAWT